MLTEHKKLRRLFIVDDQGSSHGYRLRRSFGATAWIFKTLNAGIIGGLGFAYSSSLPLQALACEAPSHPSYLSRITVDVPFYTRHQPHNEAFNNHNWGAFVDVAITKHFSFTAGDFINSYKRDTIFAGIAWMPIDLDLSKVEARAGLMAGVDINGGYRPFNDLNPFLGALSLRITGTGFETAVFNRVGLAIKVIPPDPSGGSTAINFALSYRLG